MQCRKRIDPTLLHKPCYMKMTWTTEKLHRYIFFSAVLTSSQQKHLTSNIPPQVLWSSPHLCRQCWINWTSWRSWWFYWIQRATEWRTPNTWLPSAPSPPPGSLTPTLWGTARAPWRPCWRASPAGTPTGRWDTWLKCSKSWSDTMPLQFSENWT